MKTGVEFDILSVVLFFNYLECQHYIDGEEKRLFIQSILMIVRKSSCFANNMCCLRADTCFSVLLFRSILFPYTMVQWIHIDEKK